MSAPRLWSSLAVVAAFTLVATSRAQPANPPPDSPAAGKGTISASRPARKAAWQERLTLGPGDSLNFNLYGSTNLFREDVTIGPDGRVSFLQAQDIVAAGLTIDELREKFDAELGRYYRSPRTIITPSAYRSKKFYVLGKVVNEGVYSFDRPLTVIEAIARAGGLETGVFDRNTVELADLPRSFLVRGGDRVPVDFEKLFQQGDLSQNVALEPGDYLFFPSANLNEVYVLGEVLAPGVVPHSARTTAIGAISQGGGFTDRAYKGRVLVVRGSLNQPEAFVLDTAAILAARTPDFKLEPKDIVYVSARPWIKAEELLDLAARSFIQAAIISGTGVHVDPIITSPVIK